MKKIYYPFFLLSSKSQKKILNKLYFFAKQRYADGIKFVKNASTIVNSNKNLIVIDNRASIGDFFILINSLKMINFTKSKFKYVIYCNNKFKDFISREASMENIEFIFSELDFGRYGVNKILSKKEKDLKIYRSIESIFFNRKDWNNIYICCNKIDLNHYSILFSINYNKAFVLKNFNDLECKTINNYNVPFPSLFLWIYFFYFHENLKIKIWGERIYFFGDMVKDMLIENDRDLFLEKNIIYKNDSNYLSFLFTGTNKEKTLNSVFVNFFVELISEVFNVRLLGQTNDIKDIKIPSKVTNFLNSTPNINDYFLLAKNSKYIISVDSSLFHIANYYGIKSIILLNESIESINDHIKFWIPPSEEENIFILNRNFFKNKLFNFKKKDEAKNIIDRIIKKIVYC